MLHFEDFDIIVYIEHCFFLFVTGSTLVQYSFFYRPKKLMQQITAFACFQCNQLIFKLILACWVE